MWEATVNDVVLKGKADLKSIFFTILLIENIIYGNNNNNNSVCPCPQIHDLENALAQEKLKCLEVISLTYRGGGSWDEGLNPHIVDETQCCMCSIVSVLPLVGFELRVYVMFVLWCINFNPYVLATLTYPYTRHHPHPPTTPPPPPPPPQPPYD